MNTSAVNEFLAQMNNCGDDGVFIVGATNRKDSIDPAILRAGRLDKHIYLPPPDFEARELMFKMYLSKRPTEIGLDYEKLASLSDKLVSSDIKFICDQAARIALKQNSRVTIEILTEIIESKKGSIPPNNNDRPRIGF
jgi:transitional endoplasmic reticulum ATPase